MTEMWAWICTIGLAAGLLIGTAVIIRWHGKENRLEAAGRRVRATIEKNRIDHADDTAVIPKQPGCRDRSPDAVAATWRPSPVPRSPRPQAPPLVSPAVPLGHSAAAEQHARVPRGAALATGRLEGRRRAPMTDSDLGGG